MAENCLGSSDISEISKRFWHLEIDLLKGLLCNNQKSASARLLWGSVLRDWSSLLLAKPYDILQCLFWITLLYFGI